MVKLLNERTRHVLAIGEIKLKAGEEIYAPHRERAVLNRIARMNQGPITKESLESIYREIMSSALSLENPDHAAVTVSNYRWRLGLEQSEAKYAALEARLATFPSISVPTITMEGDANGAPHPEPAAYAKRFTGKYKHELITGGVGHNLPQEAPEAFAKAVTDVEKL